MKADIHPVSHKVSIGCACGAKYDTTSTRESYAIDICSACHPFFTGKARIMDTEGRVERFRAKYRRGAAAKAEPKAEAPKEEEAKAE